MYESDSDELLKFCIEMKAEAGERFISLSRSFVFSLVPTLAAVGDLPFWEWWGSWGVGLAHAESKALDHAWEASEVDCPSK